MHKHIYNYKEASDCPFAIDFTQIKWNEVQDILSVDDFERSVIVSTNGTKYIVAVPKVLYDAIFRSGEENVIDQDLGFDELT